MIVEKSGKRTSSHPRYSCPAALIRQKWVEIEDIDGMASLFQVSRQAMAIRLSSLGLIE